MNFLKLLDGNKTYILTFIGAVFAMIHFVVVGDWSTTALLQLSQNESFIAAMAALRHGIAKVGNQGSINKAAGMIILALILCGGTSWAQSTSNTPALSIFGTISNAVQSVNVPAEVTKIQNSGLAINTGFWYDWKAAQIDATFTYPVWGAMQIGNWGTWDYINFGYASPDVLIVGTGLDINIGTLTTKWGIKPSSSIQNILNSASIGLTPMVGIEKVGSKNRFTGGPGGYIKITF